MFLADLRDIIMVKTVGETIAKRHVNAFDFLVLFSFCALICAIVGFHGRGNVTPQIIP